jgi:hypothetical protein
MFSDIKEVHRAYQTRVVDLHAGVKVRMRERAWDEDGHVKPRPASRGYDRGPCAAVGDAARGGCRSSSSIVT